MTEMIRARGLVKRYKEVVALGGLDLSVEEGTVLALLGPNGAGKTTAVRCLATLLVPDEGEASIDGVDVLADPQGVRRRIGLSGQYAAVDEQLTGVENLTMVGRLYGLGKARPRERAHELLERFDLAEAGDRPAKTYSGGMRRRLDLAGALVAEPPVLILDEPTTGLDVRSRQQMWEVIRGLVASGATLLLTTQYLEEADRLADTIVVTTAGRSPRAPPTSSRRRPGASGSTWSSPMRHTSRPPNDSCTRSRPARCRSRTAPWAARSATVPRRYDGSSTTWTGRASRCSTSDSDDPPSTTSSSP